MTAITVSFAESLKFAPKHPERTAKRSGSYDVTFKEYRTRKAMLRDVGRNESAMAIRLVPCVPFGKAQEDVSRW